jgi:Tol biopolymer transport system component
MPPANREIIFASLDATGWQLKRKAVDGREQARLLSVNWSGWGSLWPQASTPDGKVLLAVATAEEPGSGADIVAINLERDGAVEPLIVSDDVENHPVLSPDGKWLAYGHGETGSRKIFVTTFPDLKGKWLVSTKDSWEPVWAPDGKAIYYRDGTSVVAVSVETEGGFKLGQAQPLFEDVYVTEGNCGTYAIHPDGKRFLMMKEVEEDIPLTEVIVVENWFEELKRRVPTGKNQ